jgi:heptosyltransferase III
MKILVIKFRHIGDVLLSTPLVDNLKNCYPNSIIDFIVNKECTDMLSYNPNINQIIEYDRSSIQKMGLFSKLLEEIKFLCNIRKKYDLVINLTEGERGALISYFSQAKLKLGFPVRKGIFSKINIFDITADDKKIQHTIEKDLQFITLLGKKINKTKVSIYWTDETDRDVDKILKENDLNEYIHIHPVSRWMFKCWEDDRMARIIDYFIQDKKIKVVITGAPLQHEQDRIEKILSHCQTKPLNLSGKLTLKHLACLSSRAKLFFGVDSAPAHIAAATNTPTCILFGASEASKWGGWDNNGNNLYLNSGIQENGRHLVFAEEDHTIIYKDGIKKCQGMLNISADSVIQKLNEKL